MKILQVTSLFAPVHGGAAEVPYRLSRELAGRGHQVGVYTSDLSFSREYMIPEIKIHAFKTKLSLAGFQITPGMISRAAGEIRNLDVIHLHHYWTFQNIIAHHYAQKYHIPYLLQAHGSLTTFSYRGWLKRIFNTLWGRGILQDASKVIAVTEAEAEQYRNLGVRENKIEVVPDGVDLSEFENLPPKGEFRGRYGLNDNQRIVLFLGRIHKIKGLDLLLRAFAGLAPLNNARLVIVGPDAGYLSSLKKLIADLKVGNDVLCTGPLYGREKLSAYVDADVFVLPSRYEIFGIAALEACACGLPVITTERCGLAGVINGQAGLVVPYDKELLTSALKQMLGDDSMRQQLGEKGKMLVRERFNWKNIAERIELVYRSCRH
jgi:glycosyltransferase involved in cell wall biosynthesis